MVSVCRLGRIVARLDRYLVRQENLPRPMKSGIGVMPTSIISIWATKRSRLSGMSPGSQAVDSKVNKLASGQKNPPRLRVQ